MKIKDLCICERPRERLIADGPSGLSNGELIAVLLRSGTKSENVLDMARGVLSSCDGRLTALSRMGVPELCRVNGIKEGKAAVLIAAFELGRRFMKESADHGNLPLTESDMVFRMMIPRLKGLDHEECWTINLSASHKVCGTHQIGKGTADSVLMDAKDAVKRAMEDGARAMILVHNHPGGSPLPSNADILNTQTLNNACNACDLELLDHIIISDDKYYSFAEEKVSSPECCRVENN